MSERIPYEEKLAKLDKNQNWVITEGDGPNTRYGKIRDLVGLGLKFQLMVTVSLGRGTDTDFGNVDSYVSKAHLFSSGQFTLLARGLSTDPAHNDVSHLDPVHTCFKKYRQASSPSDAKPRSNINEVYREDMFGIPKRKEK